MKGRFLDYWARAETGPIVPEKDFDLKRYWPRVNELARKYKVEHDPRHIVPTDDEQLENVWKAAYELVLDVGFLCLDTARVILFTPDEIDEMIDHVHPVLRLGTGEEERTYTCKGFEDYDNQRNPHAVMGRVLGQISPEIYSSVIMSYLKEPSIDHVHFQGIISKINGMPTTPGSPWEMLAELHRVALVRDACRRVGRPGFSDGGTVPVKLQAQMAADNPQWGTPSGDCRGAYISPSMKTNYDWMCRALHMYQYGAHTWGAGTAYVGGTSGGPATSAINVCAELIGSALLYENSLLGTWALDAVYFSNSSKQSLFASWWGGAAFRKHVPYACLVGAPIQMTYKLGREYFLEQAAGAVGCTPLGFGVSGGAGAQSAGTDVSSGMGCRMSAEVGKAVGQARLTRKEANEIVLAITDKYQPHIDDRTAHTIGLTYQEAHDVETSRPKPEFLATYNQVKAELKEEFGLPMKWMETP